MKKYEYRTQGTCSQLITFEIDGETLHNVCFYGGCHGNLQGIARLVEGQKVKDVIERLNGIRCGMKLTSCPDQLCRALKSVGE